MMRSLSFITVFSARYRLVIMDSPDKFIPPGNQMLVQFQRLLRRIGEHQDATSEMRYRAQRIAGSIETARDKFYMKTPKAREEIQTCVQIAQNLLSLIDSNDNDPYIVITELEKTVSDLLKKTYDFRIKAG